jgi:hypothetical protein
MRWKIMNNSKANPLSIAKEAFSRVPREFQGVIFIFETGQKLVEFIVVRTMYVVRKLCSR